MKETPSSIRNKLQIGEIQPEQAVELFKGLHQEISPFQEPQQVIQLRRTRVELFNHNNSDLHYEQRMDLEEGIRHAVGMPIYGAFAAVDAVIDAAGFIVGELVEDVTFTTTRIVYRARDGIERGKIK